MTILTMETALGSSVDNMLNHSRKFGIQGIRLLPIDYLPIIFSWIIRTVEDFIPRIPRGRLAVSPYPLQHFQLCLQLFQ